MQTWQIGDVRITRVIESENVVPYRPEAPLFPEATPAALREIAWLAPHFVTSEGGLRMSVHALLVEAPGLKLVVDTCIGNDKPRRLTRGKPLATAFLRALEQAGFAREAVDVVVCTHLHVDHVGWNTMRDGDRWVPTFPRARYLLGHAELAYFRSHPDPEQRDILEDSIEPLFTAGLVDAVEPDHVLSPELHLVPTPGHTPGHVSVSIESRGARALITGDIMHHPCQVARPDWAVPFDEDREAARLMRHAMLGRLADSPTLVIGTHFATPTAGYVRREHGTYRFDTEGTPTG